MPPRPLEYHWSGGETGGGDSAREVRILLEGPRAVNSLALPLPAGDAATHTLIFVEGKDEPLVEYLFSTQHLGWTEAFPGTTSVQLNCYHPCFTDEEAGQGGLRERPRS